MHKTRNDFAILGDTRPTAGGTMKLPFLFEANTDYGNPDPAGEGMIKYNGCRRWAKQDMVISTQYSYIMSLPILFSDSCFGCTQDIFTTGDNEVDTRNYNTFCAVVEAVTFVSLQGIHLQVENNFVGDDNGDLQYLDQDEQEREEFDEEMTPEEREAMQSLNVMLGKWIVNTFSYNIFVISMSTY